MEWLTRGQLFGLKNYHIIAFNVIRRLLFNPYFADSTWNSEVTVRYGKWKFMNYRQDNILTYQCGNEGWSNDQYEKYLFPFKKQREQRISQVSKIYILLKN